MRRLIYGVVAIALVAVLAFLGWVKSAKQDTKWAWNEIRGVEHFCHTQLAKAGSLVAQRSQSLYRLIGDETDGIRDEADSLCGDGTNATECEIRLANSVIAELEVAAEGINAESSKTLLAWAHQYRKSVTGALWEAGDLESVVEAYRSDEFFRDRMRETVGDGACDPILFGIMLAHLRLVQKAYRGSNSPLKAVILLRERRAAFYQWFSD